MMHAPEQAAMQQAIDALEWTPCRKLPVIVHVREQRSGEQYVSTREGITPVKPDDLIMRGVSGEEYPIGRAIFQQTYTLDLSQPVNEPVAEVKAKVTGGNIGIATAIHEICDPFREPLPVGTKLYTSPSPPNPTDVPLITDDEIDAVTDRQWGKKEPAIMHRAHRAYARAIEALVLQKAGLK